MPTASLYLHFENAAGQVLAHAGGYAVLRYLPGKRQPQDIANLLTQLGQLLLRHGWHRFLADNRHMAPLNEAEKEWFTKNWLQQGVPRPAPLWAAVVLPTEVVARLAITQMMSNSTPDSIQYKAFTELAQAEAYLQALPASPPAKPARS